MFVFQGYSMISAMATTFVLSIVFLFLSKQSGKLYMSLWGCAWLVYSFVFLLDFGNLYGFNVDLYYITLRQILTIIGSYIFLYGTYHFFQTKPPSFLYRATFVFLLLIALSSIFDGLYPYTVIPCVIYCSGLLIFAGCMFISYSWTQNMPEKIFTAFLIILWAFFINHFGFTLGNVEIAVLTYFIGIFIVNMMILFLIIIYFKKVGFLDTMQSSRYRLLVENSSDSMFLYDYKTKRFEYASPLINTLINISQRQLYDSPERFFDYLEMPKKNNHLISLFSKRVSHPGKGTLCLVKDNQVAKWIAIHYTPICDSTGTVVSVEGILRDITESKTLEDKLKAAETAKTELLENISHEIRTPVTLIQGYTESLINNILPIDAKTTYLKMIYSKSMMLTNLLDDLVQISSLSSQELEYKFYEMPAIEFFDTIFEQFGFQIAQSDHKFESNISISNGAVLILDTYRISQVISNLVNNAVRHTASGKAITLSCHTYPHTSIQHMAKGDIDSTTIPTGDLVFTVTDNGDGIAPDDLPHIFKRTFQGENKISRKSAFGGSGLGLFISMSIIKQHSGNMWAENNIEGGATISFSLPYYV